MVTTQNPVETAQVHLKTLLRGVYQGRVDFNTLYEKGLEISHSLERDVGELPIPESLREAIDFIDQLHDSDTRTCVAKNPGEIYYHLRRLS